MNLRRLLRGLGVLGLLVGALSAVRSAGFALNRRRAEGASADPAVNGSHPPH